MPDSCFMNQFYLIAKHGCNKSVLKSSMRKVAEMEDNQLKEMLIVKWVYEIANYLVM